MQKKTLFVVLFIALAALLACLGACRKDSDANAQKAGANAAPAFILKSVDGKDVSLSDYAGKVIILDFWATWCPPCRREIPHFIELQKDYGNEGLQVIGISTDDDFAAVVPSFIADNDVNYPILQASEQTYNAYQQLINPDERGGIPFTFVIDTKGQIVARFVGYRDKNIFEEAIKPLLKD